MISIFSKFKKGLQKTTTTVARGISNVFTGEKSWTDEQFDDLEAMLIQSDFGVPASLKIVEDIRDRYERGQISTSSDIYRVASEDVCSILQKNQREINFSSDGNPTIILFVGVNGSGKTTSIGKLAALWTREGRKVMLAACDTFRAAAVEQLKLWGDRTETHVVSSKHGADPSSVAFDAVRSAQAKNAEILLIDTAGRQHTSRGLMDELGKIRRTIDKIYPGAPHEVWLTVDSSLGANAINQAREFSKVAGISGLVLTKLDGTGKGGMAVALQQEFGFPVFFAGFGEKPEDLQPFNPEYYASALFNTGEK
ncbi:signal recognition particle-docking protein FtsY [Lentisphaerota bacterium ZTH]|nr:signal recognition particle-docking protein FtsY [Lentisphaerota bacterium]WET06252.1 signal recognition particle-docking protein FtsY [Lentisphaerota bacterium ZTH]